MRATNGGSFATSATAATTVRTAVMSSRDVHSVDAAVAEVSATDASGRRSEAHAPQANTAIVDDIRIS